MKKLNTIILALLLTFSLNTNAQKLKRYEVKSAIVSYKTVISGKIMGSTIEGSGSENLYFKDWGDVELKEAQSSQTTKTDFFGVKKSSTQATHTMTKLDNGKSYHVDFDRKKISLRRDMAMEMSKTYADGDVNKTGKEILESMGGKIVGQEAILGYPCDIWEVLGGKQWLYKGLPLKIEMTILGTTTKTEAINAQFNIAVPNNHFKLPNFPIEEMEDYQNDEDFANDKEEMKRNAQKMKNMSYAEYKTMIIKEDPEAAEMSENEMQQSYQMFKVMIKRMAK